MKRSLLTATLLCASLGLVSAFAWQPDQGDGTFKNPVFNSDYPDPDITRVGDYFYMVSTTFVNSPGIVVLRSQDMVNWETIGNVAATLDGGAAYNLSGGTAYRSGLWASSIRHRNGVFYVVVQPGWANGRIYYTTNPAGTWQHYQLDRSTYDPGLFFDTDGTGYIFCGGGSQKVLKLNATYSAVVSQTDNVVNNHAEGTHVVKRGVYYYVFNAKPSVFPFQLLCSRSTNILGPYETRVALTSATGGHQGAIVDLPDGNWYGFVMRDTGSGLGRVTQICPIFWENDWPIWGTTSARDQVPTTAAKPILGKPVLKPADSDEFSATSLGVQWSWNHNPDASRWSLNQRSGFLRLRPTQAPSFWTARNTLTQKSQGPWCYADVRVELSALSAGDICGFGTLGVNSGYLYVTTNSNGSRFLNMAVTTDSNGAQTVDNRVTGVPLSGTVLYLRTDLDFQRGKGLCSYSTNGTSWTDLGGEYNLTWGWGGSGTFQGDRYSLFCYNPNTALSTGYMDVDWFRLTSGNVPNGTYKVLARHSGKALTAQTNGVTDGTQLVQATYTGSNSQRWKLSYVGDGEHTLIGVQSSKATEVSAWGTANGSKVQLWSYVGGTNQVFTVTPVTGLHHRLSPIHAPGSCLDVSNISTADGAYIHLWTNGTGFNKQWSFQSP